MHPCREQSWEKRRGNFSNLTNKIRKKKNQFAASVSAFCRLRSYGAQRQGNVQIRQRPVSLLLHRRCIKRLNFLFTVHSQLSLLFGWKSTACFSDTFFSLLFIVVLLFDPSDDWHVIDTRAWLTILERKQERHEQANITSGVEKFYQ